MYYKESGTELIERIDKERKEAEDPLSDDSAVVLNTQPDIDRFDERIIGFNKGVENRTVLRNVYRVVADRSMRREIQNKGKVSKKIIEGESKLNEQDVSRFKRAVLGKEKEAYRQIREDNRPEEKDLISNGEDQIREKVRLYNQGVIERNAQRREKEKGIKLLEEHLGIPKKMSVKVCQ